MLVLMEWTSNDATDQKNGRDEARWDTVLETPHRITQHRTTNTDRPPALGTIVVETRRLRHCAKTDRNKETMM